MGRIMAIDYGRKRCGIAVTDPMRIVVSALQTIPPMALVDFVVGYAAKEPLDLVVFGIPYNQEGGLLPVAKDIEHSMDRLHKRLPNVVLDGIDESYSSAEAQKVMLSMGIPKMKRRKKALTDKVSATIILRRYLEQQGL